MVTCSQPIIEGEHAPVLPYPEADAHNVTTSYLDADFYCNCRQKATNQEAAVYIVINNKKTVQDKEFHAMQCHAVSNDRCIAGSRAGTMI